MTDPDTGPVRLDLIELLVQLQRAMGSSSTGRIFPRIAQELAAGWSLGKAYRERVIEPRARILDAILQRGIDRGELPATLDFELASDLLIGPIILCRLTRRLSGRTVRQRATSIVDAVLGGVRATPVLS